VGGTARARAARRTVDRLGWTDEDDRMFQEAHAAALGSRAMVGFAAIVLGIIAVVLAASFSSGSMVLSLVALLCLGAGGLLAGSAFGAQVWGTSAR
jgi:lipopolysaccharide export LptBFGC system permease protein LptF